MDSLNESRKYKRLSLGEGTLPPATITLYVPFRHEPFQVEIKDLSAGGMKIFSREVLPHRFDFGLEFNLSKAQPFQAKAKTIYQLKTPEGYTIGLAFTAVDKAVRAQIETMIRDYYSCEERIAGLKEGTDLSMTLEKIVKHFYTPGYKGKAVASEICIPECKFLAFCTKKQKAYEA